VEAPRYIVENKVGALLEARVFGLRTREDADTYGADVGRAIAAMSRGVLPVLLADHRPVAIYPPPAADRLIEIFLDMNSRLERIAIIAARTNATLTLQLERLVREARYAKRKVFYEPADALAHLGPVLDPAARIRAQTFLAGWPPPP
jgi:hypothetical protein